MEAARTLRLRSLTKRFGPVTAVADVSLSLAPGQTLALLGPSGCGKSTLLRLVAGLERPDAGSLLLGDVDVTATPPQRRDMGMVFQAYALFPHLDVAGNVAFGLREAGVPRPKRQKRVDELLELVGLAGLGARRVESLSGGQQQRVALARALAPDPRLLLLDEPLSNLDEQLRQALQEQLRHVLGALGKQAIYVTHDQSEAFALADRVALMRAGRIVQVGSGEQLLNQPATGWAARFLGHENVFDAQDARHVPSAPVPGATHLLFRADLAALAPVAAEAGAEASSPAGTSRAEAVVRSADRVGLGWRLTLDVPAWRLNVVWRGFDRELHHGPQVGARLMLEAPAGAWRWLPAGTNASGQEESG